MGPQHEGNGGGVASVGGSEQPFGSTDWEWRKVKVTRAPQARATTRRRRGRWFHLPPWNPREPLTLKVKYRGGSEAWIEIHSRGGMGRFPGNVALYDVLREIWRLDR